MTVVIPVVMTVVMTVVIPVVMTVVMTGLTFQPLLLQIFLNHQFPRKRKTIKRYPLFKTINLQEVSKKA